MRALTSKQNSNQREKNDVLGQLQRTESVSEDINLFSPKALISIFEFQDIDDVKHQLQKYKQENHDLEKELRGKYNFLLVVSLLTRRFRECQC